MVFTTTNLFKAHLCPEFQQIGQCILTSCMFAHDLQPTEQISFRHGTPKSEPAWTTHVSPATEPAVKKRRVTYNQAEDHPPSKADLRRDIATGHETSASANLHAANTIATSPQALVTCTKTPRTLVKTVSPPPPSALLHHAKVQTSSTTGVRASINPGKVQVLPVKQESLNPRLVAIDPIGHSKRTFFLKHLHQAMLALNQKVLAAVGSKDQAGSEIRQAIALPEHELIKLALDEEERTVIKQGSVYANVIKNRIAAYKKMDLESWMEQRKVLLISKEETPGISNASVQTGLSADEECMIVMNLVEKNQQRLKKYGYVAAPPPEADAKAAALLVEADGNLEKCARCGARFQVFPTRNEDGLVTGGGKCQYHPKRKTQPDRARADMGPKEAYHPCCNEVVGTPGCAEHSYHVFKVDDPLRLHAVLPFIMTPNNESPAKSQAGKVVHAVAFDCEMGYTTLGMELIRLTAVDWPHGNTLIDIIVRPLGIILDLNSQFSGVWPRHFNTAVPYADWMKRDITDINQPSTGHEVVFPIVNGPRAARTALCSFLTPQTPLLGHALENDLNVTRLCHPTIVDTVLLFPHRRGLPCRLSLRALAEEHLARHIQQTSAGGHDSGEDAKATGDLVRVAVRNHWNSCRDRGYGFVNGQLARVQSPSIATMTEIPPSKDASGKRKRSSDGS